MEQSVVEHRFMSLILEMLENDYMTSRFCAVLTSHLTLSAAEDDDAELSLLQTGHKLSQHHTYTC